MRNISCSIYHVFHYISCYIAEILITFLQCIIVYFPPTTLSCEFYTNAAGGLGVLVGEGGGGGGEIFKTFQKFPSLMSFTRIIRRISILYLNEVT